MNKLFFLIIFILFLFSGLHAQTTFKVKFYIKDSALHHGLPGVSFRIQKDTSYSHKFLSNEMGIVDINSLSTGKYNIELSYIGYIKLDTTVLIDQNLESFIFYLKQTSNRLKGAVIESQKPFLEMKKGNFILNVQQSPLTKSGNLWEALKYAPTVITDLSGKLTIKGQPVTVYLDGRRIRLSGSDLMRYLENIPSTNIQTIEVQSHPESRYPSDVGTVLNIKTYRLKYEGIKGTITSNFALGTYPRYNDGISFDLKKSIFSAIAGYSYTNTKAESTSTVEREGNTDLPWTINQIINTKQQSNRAYANIGLDFNKNNQFSLYAETDPVNTLSEVYANNGLPTPGRIFDKDYIYKTFYTVKIPIHSYSLQATYETKWDSAKQSLKFQTAYFNNNRKGSINRYSKIFRDEIYMLNGFHYEDFLPQKLNAFVANVQYVKPFLKGDLVAGLRYSKTGLRDNNKTFAYVSNISNKRIVDSEALKYRELNYGVYSSWKRKVGKMYYQIGIRIEKNKVFANNIIFNIKNKYTLLTAFPNILVQWSKNSKSSWVLSYKKSLTRPDYYQLNPYDRFSGNNSVEFRGNQSIKPEIDHTIGLTWSNNKNLSLSAGLQISHNFISTIILKDSSNLYYKKYDNFQAKVYYLNCYYSISPLQFWQIQFNAQALYLDVNAYANIKRRKLSPAGNVSLSNTFSLPHKWKIELSTFYTTSVYDGYYKHIGHGNANFAVVKDWKKPKLSLSIGGSDILKTNIITSHAMYLLYNSRKYNDSRFFRIGITWRFGKQSVKTSNYDKSLDIHKSKERLKNGKI